MSLPRDVFELSGPALTPGDLLTLPAISTLAHPISALLHCDAFKRVSCLFPKTRNDWRQSPMGEVVFCIVPSRLAGNCVEN